MVLREIVLFRIIQRTEYHVSICSAVMAKQRNSWHKLSSKLIKFKTREMEAKRTTSSGKWQTLLTRLLTRKVTIFLGSKVYVDGMLCHRNNWSTVKNVLALSNKEEHNFGTICSLIRYGWLVVLLIGFL